jgi:hypothetical protein
MEFRACSDLLRQSRLLSGAGISLPVFWTGQAVSSLPLRIAEETDASTNHLCHLCHLWTNPGRACPPNEGEAQRSASALPALIPQKLFKQGINRRSHLQTAGAYCRSIDGGSLEVRQSCPYKALRVKTTVAQPFSSRTLYVEGCDFHVFKAFFIVRFVGIRGLASC